MPIPQSLADLAAIQRLGGTEPILWLYELEVPTGPPTRYRFVAKSPAQVTFRGNVYYPFPVSHSAETRNTEGDLQTTTLVVANFSRLIGSSAKTYGGFVDQPVRIMAVNAATLILGRAIVEQDYRVESADIDEESASFKLEPFSMYRRNFPAVRMQRNHCNVKYRSARCGYNIPVSAGGLAICSKAISGPNGCEAHGDSEVAAGQPRQHPARFGGGRGIPRRPTGGGL